MTTTLRFPQPPLSQFIECFWCQQGIAPYSRDKILPHGTVELMINFGSPHRVLHNDNFAKFALHKDAWLSGFQSEYLVTEAVAETDMVGVRFLPGGAYPFLPLPLVEVTNQVIDLDCIWGSMVLELREQLYAVAEPTTRLAHFEKFMRQQMNDNLYGLGAIQAASTEIEQIHSFSTVRSLSERMGFSQKHLIHQFKQMVGTSPKMLHRIAKFKKALYQIDPMSPVEWVHIAQECGYYDQAHFNREFTAFSGLTPTDYVMNRRNYLGKSIAQGEAVQFVPVA